MPQTTFRTALRAFPSLAAAACVAATLGLADIAQAQDSDPGSVQEPSLKGKIGRRYQTVTGRDIQRLLRKLGYVARLYKDSKGKPKIESRSDGHKFLVGFYACTSGAVPRCKSIQFYSGYRMSGPVSLVTLNDWNRRNRYARAYRQGTRRNVTFIEMDVPFMGVSDMTFRAQLNMFNRLNANFRRKIGYTSN